MIIVKAFFYGFMDFRENFQLGTTKSKRDCYDFLIYREYAEKITKDIDWLT